MCHKHLVLVAVAVLSLVWVGESNAQNMPFIDLNGMAQQNIAFGHYMDQRAWQQALNIARQLPPGYRVPFNMPAWQQSMHGYRNAADNYIHGMQQNSARRSAAIYNWNQAYLGNAYYSNGSTGYYLPYRYPAYHVDPFGWATPGLRYDRGMNVYLR